MSGSSARVGILLSTFNGERFLPAQLDSFRSQAARPWTLFWRDDGSEDGTVALMRAFAAEPGEDRVVAVEDGAHLGASLSFFTLLRAAAPAGMPLAFADQDDVWLPSKLAWAQEALAGVSGPALYCSRQQLVDEALQPLGCSPTLRRPPCLAAALTQNIVTGCTAMLNPAAARLVAGSEPPAATLHDWWSYLVVTAAGGRVLFDDRPTLLYRQHRHNLVGAPPTNAQRARAAVRRGPSVFMAVLRAHVAALLRHPELLTPDSLRTLQTIHRATNGQILARLQALWLPGFRRQTALETALFRTWFLFG